MSDSWVQMPLSALAFALQLASSEVDREPGDAPENTAFHVALPEMPDLDELTQEFVRTSMVTHPSRILA